MTDQLFARIPGELIVNENGGAQSALHGDPKLIPAEALLRLSDVVGYGAHRYAENNWRRIPFEDHLSHALEHVFLYMNGDRNEDHVGHALCRLAFAVAMEPSAGHDFKAYRPVNQRTGEFVPTTPPDAATAAREKIVYARASEYPATNGESRCTK